MAMPGARSAHTAVKAADPLDRLVVRCQAGERDAHEELYRRIWPLLLKFARKVMGPDGAEDVAQEAFITVLRRVDRYSGRSAFTTWLYRVTANQAVDMIRRQARQLPSGLSPDTGWEDPQATAPDEALERNASRTTMLAAMRRLPVDYRAALYLHYYRELPVEQVAARLDCPVGTVKSRLHRGRRELARILNRGRSSPA